MGRRCCRLDPGEAHVTWMLVSFFAYMVVILVVGFLAARKTTNTMESFYLGDRKVGAWVTAISASASASLASPSPL